MLKIGELAARTGMSVRSLHHYDAIGLLCPSERSAAGYRQYSRADLLRLQRIHALKSFGFTLAEIVELLAGAGAPLEDQLQRQLDLLETRQRHATELAGRLRQILLQQRPAETVKAEYLLDTLRLMVLYEGELDPADFQRTGWLDAPVTIDEVWPDLVAEVRTAIAQAQPPDGPVAQALAARWMDALQKACTTDPPLAARLDRAHRRNATLAAQTRIDGAVRDFIRKAWAHANAAIYARYLREDEVRRLIAMGEQQAEAWSELIVATDECMASGASAWDDRARALGRRWEQLFHVSPAAGDPGLPDRLRQVWAKEPRLPLAMGLDLRLLGFISQAMAAGRVHLICGRVGAGKSTYARRLGKQWGASVYSIDEWFSRLYGGDTGAAAPDTGGFDPAWYSDRIDRCERQIWAQCLPQLQRGEPVLLDLGFLRRERRNRFMAWAASAGIELRLHLLEAKADTRRARVEQRNSQQGETFTKVVDERMFAFAERMFEPLSTDELILARLVSTDAWAPTAA